MANSSTVLTSGYNELYNEIYCNLFPRNDGYKKCSNCNYGNATVWQTVTSSGQQDCQNKCTDDARCTSYSYNTRQSNNNCTKYISFPDTITRNVPNINSGYSLTRFPFDFSNLTNVQKENVKNKCANQYLNNTFTPENPEVNFTECLLLNNRNNISELNVDPKCVFDTYKQNNLLTNIINHEVYNNTLSNGSEITKKTDPIIDTQYTNYQNYYKFKNNNLDNNKNLMNNINNTFSDIDNNLSNENTNLEKNIINKLQNNPMIKESNILISDSIGIKEGFDNQNKKNNFMFIILIVFLILFLFYVFKKK
jgi:hypothetical protein